MGDSTANGGTAGEVVYARGAMSGLTLLEPGCDFARDFRIVRPLADGGMSSVYVAEQRSSGKLRALKILSGDYLRDAASRAQFEQEARIGSMIKSGHVVEVIAAGIDEETDLPWMAMELLDGEDLADLVTRRGRIPFHEVREILEQLGDALIAAHEAGVIHRDLKPRNIFVARSQLRGMPFVVKVLDFGISKLIDRSATSVGITRQLGSPLFMAPEQARSGARLRRSTDIWPLGLLAYFLTTGRYYWKAVTEQGVNINALMLEIAVDPIEAPSVRAASQGLTGVVPEGFDAWFLRCMSREPEGRWPDARAAMEGFTAALTRPRRGFDEGSEPTVVRRLPDDDPQMSVPTDVMRRPATLAPARVSSALAPMPTPPVRSGPHPVAAPVSQLPVSGAFVAGEAIHATTEPPGSSVRALVAASQPVPSAVAGAPSRADVARGLSFEALRSQPKVWLLGAATLVFLALSGGYMLAGIQVGQTAAEAAQGGAELNTVQLHFQGLPSGARVTVAGVPFYSDTAFAARGQGAIVVEVSAAGYEPAQVSVVPDRDQEVSVPQLRATPPVVPVVPVVVAQTVVVDAGPPDTGPSPAVERAPSTATHHPARVREPGGSGTLVVGADPPRCEVFVDGHRVGLTPVFGHTVGAGEHRVICRRQGHLPMLRTARVERGGEREVFFPAP